MFNRLEMYGHTRFEVGHVTPVSSYWGERMGIDYLHENPAQAATRNYSGCGNNVAYPDYGRAGTSLRRVSSHSYGDGVGSLRAGPNPRVISNIVCAASNPNPSSTMGLTNITWLWGQILDHELDLTKQTPAETANMTTPPDDAFPGLTIPFQRSIVQTGLSPREHANVLSSYIDGGVVYGDEGRANLLRAMDGTGKLKTQTLASETMLPYNAFGLENGAPVGSDPLDFFAAGDIRVNENVFLTAMHTLFVREHNRLCDVIVQEHPTYAGQDELVFQRARRFISAYLQQITFAEFLPVLFGPRQPLPAYTGYKADVDASISTEFSTVGFRLGHTMLPSSVQLGGALGTLTLRDAFFDPAFVATNGVDVLLKAAATTLMSEIDHEIVDDVRSFLFGPPGVGGLMLDLPSLNIQRGRDHGVPVYNVVRVAYGLPAAASFANVTQNVAVQQKLSAAYGGDVALLDPWVGMLCEDHLPGSAVGPLVHAILREQFMRVRDGDRFWFENDLMLSDADKAEIRATRLSAIVNRNSARSVQADAFHV